MVQRTIGSYYRAKPGKSKKTVKVKEHTKTIKRMKQTGNQSKKGKAMDKARKKAALPPGKRRKADGTYYTETRKNRSDKSLKLRV